VAKKHFDYVTFVDDDDKASFWETKIREAKVFNVILHLQQQQQQQQQQQKKMIK